MATTTTTTTGAELAQIKAAKKALRAEIDSRLRQLSPAEVVRQSEQVHEKLFAMAEFRAARRVGTYLSLPAGEVDTIRILARCFADGKQCFVPRYRPKSKVMDFVELRSMQDYEQLPVEPKWQIKQPDPDDASRVEALSTGGLDLLLVPGVAFTSDGHRLGHGMGYFDRWQARCTQTPGIAHPVTVALALTPQIVPQVPLTELDVQIHRVLAP